LTLCGGGHLFGPAAYCCRMDLEFAAAFIQFGICKCWEARRPDLNEIARGIRPRIDVFKRPEMRFRRLNPRQGLGQHVTLRIARFVPTCWIYAFGVSFWLHVMNKSIRAFCSQNDETRFGITTRRLEQSPRYRKTQDRSRFTNLSIAFRQRNHDSWRRYISRLHPHLLGNRFCRAGAPNWAIGFRKGQFLIVPISAGTQSHFIPITRTKQK
jgi:hypothetical protein